MKILLTGAGGFIGGYVLKFLLNAGYETNILVRDNSKFFNTGNTNLKVYTGSITDTETVNESIRGCDIVIHMAALVRSSAQNPNDFFETNVQGTLNLLKASEKNKIKKFIFVSSLSAFDTIKQSIINEEALIKPKKYFSEYAESKAKAEELVLEYSKSGFSYIILYPTRIFGIGPLTDSNGATKAISLYLKNKLPFVIDGGKQFSSWAFAEDVAMGIVNAVNHPVFNERYILGGENRTLSDVYDFADRISGRKHLRINLKNSIALSLASAIEFHSKLFNKKPLVTREWLNYVMESQKVSSEKAIAQLNYQITPIENALEKTIRWLNTL
jgi:nucleoside-diphosphate-sugar epimerase